MKHLCPFCSSKITTRRKDCLYCSNKCKQGMYRLRKENNQEAIKGVTMEVIEMQEETKQKIKLIALNAQREACDVMKAHNIPIGTKQAEIIEYLSEVLKLGLGE